MAVRGAVQGVGFRPWIFRLAAELHLNGWVNNTPQGVFIEVEGEKEILDRFLLRVRQEPPPRAFIQTLEYVILDPAGYDSFVIRESENAGGTTALILPDIAPCPDCLGDISDPDNRRHGYAFTNCTNCGPRYTIITALPYDRPNTTMAGFVMCDDCRHEYENPLDRRFHAQPNACPVCGPHLVILKPDGAVIPSDDEAALDRAADTIRRGKIAAVKGVGGFHLMADARNAHAVRRMRMLKNREEKPFALMYPSLDQARSDCAVSPLEEQLLHSPESPIVLLDRLDSGTRTTTGVVAAVAPNNPTLGIMLPPSPLHHLLMNKLQFPVVATSGNVSDEPICIDRQEALSRLGGMADCFLDHNRPIRRHVDDSIVRVVLGREFVLRRARGYAPLPVPGLRTEHRLLPPMIAVGPHLKNTVAISAGDNVILSQHIGDLETREAFDAFERTGADLCRMYNVKPSVVIADLHPDYLSTHHASGMAKDNNIPAIAVQHHYAHIAACMGENGIDGELLGVSWDGAGLGPDGAIWGGEFLTTGGTSFTRKGTMLAFRLPGADRAIKEPRRTALGVLYEIFGETLFQRDDLAPVNACTRKEIMMFRQMLRNRLNTPVTTSAGRLFDAVASVVGLRQRMSFEGQAAMELEHLLMGARGDEQYPVALIDDPEGMLDFIVNWKPMILQILIDLNNGESPRTISLRFHNSMAELIVQAAKRTGLPRVALSGGCFQNRYLLERSVRRLEAEGFRPYWHQRVPTNDGGVAFGQIVAYLRSLSLPQSTLMETISHASK